MDLTGTLCDVGSDINAGDRALLMYEEFMTWRRKVDSRYGCTFPQWIQMRKDHLVALHNAVTGYSEFVPRVKEPEETEESRKVGSQPGRAIDVNWAVHASNKKTDPKEESSDGDGDRTHETDSTGS